MTVVQLAAEERLAAAFTRYDAVWPDGRPQDVVAARIALCRALLDVDEVLPPAALSQLARDEACPLASAG